MIICSFEARTAAANVRAALLAFPCRGRPERTTVEFETNFISETRWENRHDPERGSRTFLQALGLRFLGTMSFCRKAT